MIGHNAPGRKMPRRRWVAAAVIGFLAVDALLVGIAFSVTRPGPQLQAGPIPTFGSSATPSAAPSASPTPSPSPSPTAVAAVAAPRFLAPVSATEAWRASTGSCPGSAAVVERTTDKGETWQRLDLKPTGIRQVFSLINVDRQHATLIGAAGPDCEVGLFTSSDSGKTWEKHTENLGSANYLDSREPANLQTTEGTQKAPCARAVQLRYNSAATAVLCANTLYERTDSAEWIKVAVPRAVTVATTPAGYAVASAGADDCAGLQIATLPSPLTSSTKPKVVGCAESITTPEEATLSQSGRSLWLWSGDSVLVSSDGGATWP